MIKIVSAICLFASLNLHAQKGIFVADSLTHETIPNVKVYGADNKIQAVANDQGFLLLQEHVPLRFTHFAYREKFVPEISGDTLFLAPKVSELEAFNLVYMKTADLYARIIALSSKQAARKNQNVTGIYTENIVWVERDSSGKTDTVFFDYQCELNIQAEFKKKEYIYSFVPANGFQNVHFTKPALEIDTALYEWRLIPKFRTYLKYDLMSKEPFALKYEESQFKRIDGSPGKITFGENRKHYNSRGFIYFNADSLLLNWSNSSLTNREYDNQPTFFNIDESYMNISFSANEPYRLNEVLCQNKYTLFLSGKQYDIYVLKSFAEDSSITTDFSNLLPVKNIEDYFSKKLPRKSIIHKYAMPFLMKKAQAGE